MKPPSLGVRVVLLAALTLVTGGGLATLAATYRGTGNDSDVPLQEPRTPEMAAEQAWRVGLESTVVVFVAAVLAQAITLRAGPGQIGWAFAVLTLRLVVMTALPLGMAFLLTLDRGTWTRWDPAQWLGLYGVVWIAETCLAAWVLWPASDD